MLVCCILHNPSSCILEIIFFITFFLGSIFMVKVPFFGHKIRVIFFILLNIYFTYNQFKCEILDNSNNDNSYGDDHFSLASIFIVMIPFLDTWFKDFNFIMYQIQNLHGINLSVKKLDNFIWWWWFFTCICNYSLMFC